jgi:hypothetical protein
MFGPVTPSPLVEMLTLRPPQLTLAGVGIPELVFLILIGGVFAFLWRKQGQERRVDTPGWRHPPEKGLKPQRDRNWILVDGSNVMHWEDNTPQIEPVRRVVAALKARGLDPGVVFDANVGWKLVGRHLGEDELGRILELPADQVLVVPKGSPPDPWLLTTARDFGARIVTNDRFQDWAEEHPEVAEPGFLIRGSVAGDGVWLEGMRQNGDVADR